MLFVPLIVGCEGCRRDPLADKDKSEEEIPVDAFTTLSPDPFPSAGLLSEGGAPAGRAVKPGHWITSSISIRSNQDDSRGEMVSRAEAGGVNFNTGESSSRDAAVSIPNSRPVVLPKGQMRRFDYRILLPTTGGGDRNRCVMGGKFIPSDRAVSIEIPPMPFVAMEPEEYFMVVLTNRPERFTKIRKADWIKPFRSEFDFPINGANYRVIIASTTDILPLAETMLDWTNTAVVIWDDVGDDVLTPDQRTAMSDWIRFGGQLIINGPDASDAVARGSLSDVLAFKPTGNVELDIAAGETLLTQWQVPTDASTAQQIALLKAKSGRVGVAGPVVDGAAALKDSAGLVVRRQMGRGLVTQTRFDLTSDWIVDWESYDSFFNNAILNRPHRNYSRAGTDAETGVDSVRQFHIANGSSSAEASMNTTFRIASRDALLRATGGFEPDQTPAHSRDESESTSKLAAIDAYTRTDGATGIGGWKDTSDLISVCDTVLRSESGIEIPPSALVVRSLGYYLLILVPLNFIVFRLMGRLEYAWLAVPFIAIGGAVWVARAARLDIGFARSQTELALLEIQPNYPRAHLTRVDAIYNSLSSTYRFNFSAIDGCAAPMRNGLSPSGSGTPMFNTSFNEGPSLTGFSVGSNQVRMLHAEQIVDVGGAIEIDSDGKLVNGTSLEISDAFVVEKSEDGFVRVAVVGLVGPSAQIGIRFRDSSEVNVSDELPMQTAKLIRRLAAPSAMPNGETRLVGRVGAAIDGMNVLPKANQVTAQTIVLAYLRHAPYRSSRPDLNLKSDVSPQYRSTTDINASKDASDSDVEL
ncbi:hypothetical protein Poly51_09250 [Rubripirellula tenax]|uniref:Uncharacterized protein n=2 Tax=Rubripirellula tenax TaxID=2528015 RepID=A0A5C6FIL9_9BACT|nr:hypothetical protein Poly51_09250 [Rubripirellula tenax]